MKTPAVKCGECKEVRPLRAYLVRWLDEDRGPRSLVVAALSPDAARDNVEDILGFVPVEIRDIAALHAV